MQTRLHPTANARFEFHPRAGAVRGTALLVVLAAAGAGVWLLMRTSSDAERQAALAPAEVAAAERAGAQPAPLADGAVAADRGERAAQVAPPLRIEDRIVRVDVALRAWSETHSGHYPGTLEALILPDDLGRVHLSKDDIVDPWGRRLIYVAPGNRAPYQLHSFGRDGEPGGEGEDSDVFIADLIPR